MRLPDSVYHLDFETDGIAIEQGAPIGGGRARGVGSRYRLHGPHMSVSMLYVYWKHPDGQQSREVRIEHVEEGPQAVTAAQGRRRLEVRRLNAWVRPGDWSYCIMKQARVKNPATGWSSLYLASMKEMDAGAGMDCSRLLNAAGCMAYGAQEDILGIDHSARRLLCAVFESSNEIGPVTAAVVSRVLPLLHGFAAR